MKRTIVATLQFMKPTQFEDGYGFASIVQMSDGQHALISEIHRESKHSRLDETMVFSCDLAGNVKDWGELYCAREGTTQDAIRDAAFWLDPGRYT